jgi:Sugar-transfer associated ATP-grasp
MACTQHCWQTETLDLTPSAIKATDKDIRDFRRIRSQQRKTQLDHWQGTPLRKTLVQINRALGGPWRIPLAARAAVLGIYRSGAAVSARHGIGVATQFLEIFAEVMRSGIWFEEYYLYQLYLPDRWRSRTRQFPDESQSIPAQQFLIECKRPSDFQLVHGKHLFPARCEEAKLPSVPLLAEFVDGHPNGKLETLPAIDLVSKPADLGSGYGVESWRYDGGQNCFFNAVTNQRFSRDALHDHLCDLSSSRRIILQGRLKNHAALAPLTNGALSTLRIVTCITPSRSIDLMPPIIRMPAGRSIVDNFAQNGLAAPIDLATGTVCGAAVQMDNYVGLISTERHPDSGQVFIGFCIPRWTEAVQLARRAHQTFSSLPFIAWDIAILQDGPVLIEGNPIFHTDATLLPHRLTLSDTQFIPYYNYHWVNSLDVGD